MAPKIKPEPKEDDRSSLSYSRTKRSRSRSGWLFNILTRLTVWYTIVQVIFFCPTSITSLTANHSPVCRPYIQARDYLSPHITPLYETYAAPYVNIARPYTDTAFQTAINPALSFAKSQYDRFGAPRVAKGQAIVQAEWDKSVKPQVDQARVQAQAQYDALIAPHVSQAIDALQPHYDSSKRFAEDQYSKTFVPAYERSLPYAQALYQRLQVFAVEVGYPYAKWAGDGILQFILRKAWPQIRILYGENVHPQLVKIRERLSNYREGKRLEALVEQAAIPETPSETAEMLMESLSSAASKVVSAVTDYTVESSTITATSDTQEASESAVIKQVAEELKSWQSKFIKAADKGAEDLNERISEISSSQISSGVKGTGEALITRLEETAKTAIEGLKGRINHVVERLPEEPTDEDNEKAIEKIRSDIRTAGQHVKIAAQDLRSWKFKFVQDTASLIDEASHSTLEVLDGIRDLGLQEIGMRWASMDGVTYQDWSEYHSLKKTFDKWRLKVDEVASTNGGLDAVSQAADDIEAQGMATAEDAAKELMRLKDVAIWKVHAQDSSDDFSTRVIPVAAVKASAKVADQLSDISEAIVGTKSETGTWESVTSEAADAITNAASSAFSVMDPAASSASSINSKASEAVVDPIQSFISPIVETQTILERASAIVEGIVEDATPSPPVLSKIASSFSSRESEIASTASSLASEASVAISESASSLSQQASESIDAASTSVESAASVVSSAASEQSSSASSAISDGSSYVSSKASEGYQSASSLVMSSSSSSDKILSNIVEKVQEATKSASSSIVPSASSSVAEAVSSASEIISGATQKAKVVGGALRQDEEGVHTVNSHDEL